MSACVPDVCLCPSPVLHIVMLLRHPPWSVCPQTVYGGNLFVCCLP